MSKVKNESCLRPVSRSRQKPAISELYRRTCKSVATRWYLGTAISGPFHTLKIRSRSLARKEGAQPVGTSDRLPTPPPTGAPNAKNKARATK